MNPAFDLTLTLDGPLRTGAVHRVETEHRLPAGKGLNVARLLDARGCRVACGGLCGNADLEAFSAALPPRVSVCFRTVAAETRRNLTLLADGDEYKINRPGFPELEYSETLIAETMGPVAEQSEIVILSGSLPAKFPADTYGGMLRTLKERGCRTVLDTSGAALKSALRNAVPDVIKPNRSEAEILLGRPLRAPADLPGAVRALLSRASMAILSDGAGGAWFAERGDGRIRHATSPEVVKRDSTGAGDSLLAQFCADYFASGLTPETMARAVAAGAATAECPGAECPAPERIDTLAKSCRITEHASENL